MEVEHSSRLVIEYIALVLKQIFPKFGDQNRRIPTKPDGLFNLEAQKRVAKKYQDVEDKKSQAIDMLKRIIDTQVKIELE